MYNSLRENTARGQQLSITQSLTDALSGRGKRWVVVIEVYLDESGTHGNNTKVLCVAGYAGDKERWDFFSKEWQAVLDKFDIPLFHASDSRCDKLRPCLVETIFNSGLKSISCSVDPETFGVYAGAHLKSAIGNAYACCAVACGLEISRWCVENNLKPVSIFLEAGASGAPNVERAFFSMIGNPAHQISRVAFALKRDYLPLQSADFLSHVIGTGDSRWQDELWSSQDNILHAHLDAEQLVIMSQHLKELYSRQRALRKKQKGEILGE